VGVDEAVRAERLHRCGRLEELGHPGPRGTVPHGPFVPRVCERSDDAALEMLFYGARVRREAVRLEVRRLERLERGVNLPFEHRHRCEEGSQGIAAHRIRLGRRSLLFFSGGGSRRRRYHRSSHV